MKARFRGLQLVALVSKGIGWVGLLAGLVVGTLVAQGLLYFPLAPFTEPYSIGSLLGGVALFAPFFLGFLLLYGWGGALQVLMAIEQNTRAPEQAPSQPEDPERPREGDLGESS